jgi:uncharacterized protein YdbL (DUF1318 family)
LLLAALATAALPALAPRAAHAQAAEQLRSSGTAGERWDGYMEARDASATGAVAKINEQRRQIYQERATQQKAPVDEVGKVYAQQIFQQSAPGTWFKKPNGQWVQK